MKTLLCGYQGYLGSYIFNLLDKYCDLEGIEDGQAPQKNHYDRIILANGLSDHILGQKNPYLDFCKNLKEPLELLESLDLRGSRILHLGSLCQYGKMFGDVNEQYFMNPLEPQGANKLYMERYLGFNAPLRGFRWLSLRLGAVVGGKMNLQNLSLLEKIVLSTVKNERFSVYGGKKRSYCWMTIEIFCTLILHVLQQDFFPDQGRNAGFFNSFFADFSEFLNLEFVSSPDQEEVRIDSEKIIQELGWRPENVSVAIICERIFDEISKLAGI